MMWKARDAGSVRRNYYFILLLAILLFIAACGRGSQKKSTVYPGTTTAPIRVDSQVNLGEVTGELKIGINQEGLYEIAGSEIVKNLPGWANLDPAQFQLSLRGQSQPVWIRKTGNSYSLVFYGAPSESRYTGVNNYLLTADGGDPYPIQEMQPEYAGTSVIDSVGSTLHMRLR
jgi:hypothetical protein